MPRRLPWRTLDVQDDDERPQCLPSDRRRIALHQRDRCVDQPIAQLRLTEREIGSMVVANRSLTKSVFVKQPMERFAIDAGFARRLRNVATLPLQ